jgi:hypothetical protein
MKHAEAFFDSCNTKDPFHITLTEFRDRAESLLPYEILLETFGLKARTVGIVREKDPNAA